MVLVNKTNLIAKLSKCVLNNELTCCPDHRVAPEAACYLHVGDEHEGEGQHVHGYAKEELVGGLVRPRRSAARQQDGQVGREAGRTVDVENDELRHDNACGDDPDDDDG